MRAFLLGFLLLIGLSLTVLSIRPGGLRRQLGLAARRFRLVLVMGGIYVISASVIRVFFPEGWVADYGPPVIALALGATFLVLAQDPATPPTSKP
ncbi:MAG: hypothetical protein AUG06_03420 [Actinobacteria bacterium 13_1_20CM_2_65_11]|nr:MAG: hypothetical protein AUH40_00265 [Chloroflexi bacterium 13_1_40CM_65_17]OLC68971.1 MAG: hypothetical protein AUH69_00170 [Actinobacteria bacterium 13_1_40CM_4_65_12]OLD48872.1 MAG: hypothetical protein AUI42_10335 [Actinobacteria bacterium 13_1_40CM_2_65_8]OLE80835.1 MAG: hypothetical protein AUG06_03420 [Actinobacteria bacterium 13_1_20CM_2_65_11]